MRLSIATTFSLLAAAALGCAAPLATVAEGSSPGAPSPLKVAANEPAPADPEVDRGPQNGQWIGAAGLSDVVRSGSSETMLGVWVDVPTGAKQAVPGSAVALVIDTSGSMAGAKIDNARAAAQALVQRLPNGDLAGLYTFSDEVSERMPLTVLSAATRPGFVSAISALAPAGGTNLFEGLRSGERAVFAAPGTHPVKRVVVISDGKANVGPTTPDVLGVLASRGAEHGIQVTAVGVGLDYDESTLNALVDRSDGRLYHLTEPDQMTAILEKEMGLLKATAVTGAFVDILPAPGVELLGIEILRATRIEGGGIRVPLGSMFAGQHREILARVRVTAQVDGSHPLASVRLHFRDPSDGNIERVHETVARYEVTRDAQEIARRENARTRQIVAVVEASKLAGAAAEKASRGDADKAAEDLAKAEATLLAQARATKDEAQRNRITASAATVSRARKATEAAAAAPAAARPKAARAAALEANQVDVMLAR